MHITTVIFVKCIIIKQKTNSFLNVKFRQTVVCLHLLLWINTTKYSVLPESSIVAYLVYHCVNIRIIIVMLI